MIKRNAAVWAGLLLLAFAVTILIQSFSYPYHSTLGPGPGLFPRWLCILLIVLAGLYIQEAVRKEVITFADILPHGAGLRNVITILLALIVFLVVVPYAGFVISSSLFLCILLAKEYKWYLVVAISVVTSLVLFWLFDTMLSVPLPVNAFGW